jgi:predicted GIY-YIG superfamily endonuclease
MWGGTINKEYIVYKATNKINGKIYVGKTYNFEKRKKEHIYDIDNDIPFHRALKKYGIDNFEWEIINHFPNCSEAARYLGEPTKVHKQIHKALKLNKRCRGFYWRKYDDYMRTQQGNTEVTA